MDIGQEHKISLTEYLGCMHAFVNVFIMELYTVRDFAKRLEKVDRASAFGWESTLDRARNRAPIVLDRWKHFNDRFRDKITVDQYEEEHFGAYVPLFEEYKHTCDRLYAILEKLNRYADEIVELKAEEVIRLEGYIEEMMAAINREQRASSSVASTLERRTPDDLKLQDPFQDELIQINSDPIQKETAKYFRFFVESRDIFHRDLNLGVRGQEYSG